MSLFASIVMILIFSGLVVCDVCEHCGKVVDRKDKQ